MYTTLLQLTNCQTILRARIKFYGSLTKRIESQNHQSMYNCSFPTFFSMWSPKLPTATWPQGVLGLLLFFFFKDQLEDPSKTIHQLKPTREKSSSPDANATLLLFPIACANESCRPRKEKGSQSAACGFGFLSHERQDALPGLTSTPGYMDLRKHRLLGSKAFEIIPV